MYYFIINPHSKTGQAKKYWKELRQILDSNQIQYKAYFTRERGHATILASQICNQIEGIKQIIIVGGDGTANEVINGLSRYSEVILGYIPLGSSNDLARGLNLPQSPKQALNIITHPKCYHSVDHGIITMNDTKISRRFAVSSGIGLDAAICSDVQISQFKKILNKLKAGKLIYILIALKQIFTQQPVEAEIIVDSFQHIHIKKLVFITSLIHKCEGGGLLMAPNANYTDQRLSVCLVSDLSRFKMLVLMPTIFFGKHTKIKGVSMIDCNTVQVKTKRPMTVHTDGEVIGMHTDLTLSCYHEQIKMPIV